MQVEYRDCPNVTQDVAASYNRLVAAFERLREKLPGLAKTDEMSQLLRRLEPLGRRIQSDRIQVVLFGPTGSQKSTTLANLLRGSFDWATKDVSHVATRIRTMESDLPFTRQRLRMRYMSAEEFRDRVVALCGLLDVDFSTDYAGLAATLDPAALARSKPQYRHECDYLAGLLLSHAGHSAKLGDSAVERRIELDKHLLLKGASASASKLLREVSLRFPSDEFDEDIEFIDLPGMAVTCREDDRLSVDFFDEADAALLFLSAEQLGQESSREYVERVRDALRSEKLNRSWLVVTGCDASNVLSGVSQAIDRLGWPLERVLAISNDAHAAASDSGPFESAELPPYAVGLPEDGGIGRLREQVKNDTLPEALGALQSSSEREIAEITTEFKRLMEHNQKRAVMSGNAVDAAAQWYMALGELSSWLRSEKDLVEQPVRRLEQSLVQRLERLVDANDHGLGRKERSDSHQFICGQLTRRAVDLVCAKAATAESPEQGQSQKEYTGCLVEIYEQVEKRLSNIEAPPVPVGDGTAEANLDPKQRWAVAALADLQQPAWASDAFQAFSLPFPGVGGLDDKKYRTIMMRKISVLVHDFAFRVSQRITGRIRDYQRQFMILGGDVKESGGADAYTNILSALDTPEEA